MKSKLAKSLAFATVIALVAARVGLAEPAQSDQSKLRLPDQVTFNAHIRPIMSNTCFACHGPDEDANDSGLRLDSFELATESAIVPGDADASDVYRRLVDVDDPMPPTEFRHQLSDREKALFKKWIDQGAKYEQHWSYTPLEKPPIVDSKSNNPIDGFIIARLATEGLSPSQVADKATLLRRLSLDLIGLPPTPEQIDSFIADDADDAYEKQVDRLLASPHYGERMATAWLDIVRFSDTVGFHGDQNQRIFAYRDYVIDSINQNKPFDQFTIEQLAGDLLENPTEEQLVATGLNRLNMVTREGGAQPGEYLAKYKADRVRMIGTAWLGSTTGCCECHNHKYDPFTAKDFYSLGAFFDDLRQWGVYSDYGYTPNKDLKGFNNDYPFPPEMRLKSRSLEQEIALLERELESSFRSTKPLDEATRQWAADAHAWLQANPSGWQTLSPTSVNSAKESTTKLLGTDVLVSGETKKDDTVTWQHEVTSPTAVRTVQLQILPDDANGGHVGRSAEGRFSVATSIAIVRDGKDVPLKIAFGQADRQNPKNYQSGHDPRFLEETWRSGPIAWQLPANETTLPHTAVYHLDELANLLPGDRLEVRLRSDDVGRFRVSTSPFARMVVGQPSAPESLSQALAAFDQGAGSDAVLSASQTAAILTGKHGSTVSAKDQSKDYLRIRNEILDRRSGYAMTLVSQSLSPEQIPVARVLPRGNWQDESGEVITPAFPEFLTRTESEEPDNSNASEENPRRLTRLDLARWLTSDENPIVARHYVNRTWKHFFGAGLSNKLDDLGSQGEWPSHPLLLDWLAAEFRDGWDMKHIARLILTSDTYRQAAAVRDDLIETDPYNRLLSQQSARRLEAEAIRDNALSIAGLLNTDIVGGPSVFPYQPEGYYSNIQFPNRTYVNDTDFGQYRRGVYMHCQRSFLHPMLVNFDAPARDECVADRPQSNSPQQALTLLNDPSFVETAKALSNRMIAEDPGATIQTYVDRAYRLSLARPPRPEEIAGLTSLYENQLKHFRDTPDDAKPFAIDDSNDAAERAALAQVCRVILNLHETITRY
ncbi:PSD1 and planctomycete cytochrome C domain-containing protein [Rubripirellula reticaptiva]|uniref:Planctomycete cytochrome C n=1 Tax=Rubripirellula reticaptiva TaxID=2528013 RepID=A0A5C6EJ35_9BACT|nr:PSD1 and planctomycete cytochrome C domain-containing protein [Rubripirellula reticaptiva]TWU48097.1 Planctomycete cytochrome C [Rubripirellula reticaptiva]